MRELSLNNVGHVMEQGRLVICGAQRLELGGHVSVGVVNYVHYIIVMSYFPYLC